MDDVDSRMKWPDGVPPPVGNRVAWVRYTDAPADVRAECGLWCEAPRHEGRGPVREWIGVFMGEVIEADYGEPVLFIAYCTPCMDEIARDVMGGTAEEGRIVGPLPGA